MQVTCTNCRLSFKADDDSFVRECPRCSSTKLRKELDKKPDAPKEFKPRVYNASGVVYGDTKDAWKSFHAQDVKTCKCGSTEFDLNWKRKEKVCRKCGEVYALPRRSA